MEGTITITVTGTEPTAPAPVLGSVKAGLWVQNGPALAKAATPTWDAKKQVIRMEAGEPARRCSASRPTSS